MNITIIIARYNESLEWINVLQNVMMYNKPNKLPNIIIYNKGHKLPNKYNEILLNNVGREGHTYYKYIYDNYDNLDEYTIFLQGYPFDHSPNIINNIKYINESDIDIDFEFLSERILNCNLSGCVHHGGLPLIDVYEKLFNEQKTDMPFIFGAGAQFIVSRKQILKRPREFYLKIIKMLEYDINPIEGFVIERFHKLIFS